MSSEEQLKKVVVALANSIVAVNNAIADLKYVKYETSAETEGAFNRLRIEQAKAIGVLRGLNATGVIVFED